MSKSDKPPDPDEGEDLAHYDDAIIGRAFRWSAVVFVFLIGAGIAVFMAMKRKPPKPPAIITATAAPVVQQFAPAPVPDARFKDVTEASGITFSRNDGSTGEKLLPETMGGGVAFLDFDGDGDQDLLFINSTWWPGKTPAGKGPTTAALYENDGKGNFKDVTAGSGLDVPLYGMGLAVGDFDNDGREDVLITGVGGNHLYQNVADGKFKDVTIAAGVGGTANDWSTAATWLDIDNDGDLDLFVGNYVRWSPQIDLEVGYKLVGVGRAYGQPMNFEGAFPRLYRNDGNGRFTEISGTAGIQIKNTATGVPAAKTLGVSAIDVDNDGWMDLIVANDTVQNFLFHNERNGTFKEIGALSGIAFDSFGATRGAMGIDAARYRNDGSLGIVIGNFANEMTALYVSEDPKKAFFTDEAITEGIGPASRLLLKFGVFFFDYDLDGRQDILSANGHLEQEISKIQKSQRYQQPAQLFWNSGSSKSGCFTPVDSVQAGKDLFKPIVGRGSAFADIDGDGDLDVVLTQTSGKPLLLRNDQNLGHHYVRLKLIGKKSNRDAIGSWVHAKVDSNDLWRQVMPTRSYLSQSELPVTLGLDKSTSVSELEVIWASGAKQKVQAKVDALTVVEEP